MSRIRAGLVAVLFAITACEEETAGSIEQPSVFARGADQVMLDTEHYLTRDGIRRGLLLADTAFTYQDESLVELRVLEIRFFDDAGADRGLLTAESGDYDLASGDLTVRGNVELEGRLDGGAPSRLETDSLRFDASGDELSTDARWTLTHPDGMVERGTTLVTDPGLENVRATGYEVTAPDVVVPQ